MKKLGLLILLMVTLIGCSSAKVKDFKEEPSWVINPSNAVEGSVTELGIQKIGKGGIGFARERAISKARANLAANIKAQVAVLAKNYEASAGSNDNEGYESVYSKVSQELSNESLRGSKVLNMYRDEEKNLYVLVGVPEETVQDGFNDTMSKELKKVNERKYQEFKAYQAQQELEKKLKESK